MDPTDTTAATSSQVPESIGIRDATFVWDKATTAAHISTRKFRLTIEDEVLFERGKINLIIGQTGSGKTSFLMALLGEMRYEATSPNSFVSLPRGGGVAYHAQESWILNETIRVSLIVSGQSRSLNLNRRITSFSVYLTMRLVIEKVRSLNTFRCHNWPLTLLQ